MFFFSRCEPSLTCIFKSSLFQVAELVEDVSKTVGDLEASASLCSSVLPLATLVRDQKCIEPSYANKTYCIEIVEL